MHKPALHFISILLLFLNILNSDTHQQNNTVIISGVSSTIDDTVEIIKGIGGFIDSLKAMISVITGIIGLKAIVLFIVVSLIGSGLSFFGIPRGKASFFCSLLITDIFWFIWIKNLSSDYIEIVNQIWIIIKTNLILIIPFVLIYIFKSKSLFRKSLIKSIFRILPISRNKKSLKRNYAVKITEDFQERSSKFQKSLFNDLLAHNDNDDVILSTGTLKQKKELEELLKEIK